MKDIIPAKNDPDYPFIFRIARTLHTLLKGYRGEYYLYSLLAKYDRLGRAGRFDYFGGDIYVPLRVPETLAVDDFSLFQGLREVNFAHQLNQQFDEFVMLDCGAYFGQVSMRIAKLCPGLRRVVFFDPNPENCEYSSANLQMTNVPFDALNAAVSDFTGKAVLRFPDGPNVPDSAFIEKGEEGDINVVRLDDIGESHGIDLAGKNLAIKLDVEGQEQAAVFGAERVIREAAGVCFFMELHPGVLSRAGQTAQSLLQSVSGIRPARWYVADEPNIELSLDAPIFEQIGQERICDVIGVAI